MNREPSTTTLIREPQTMITTEVAGRRSEAQALADLLRKTGHAPKSVTVLGAFAHVTFRGEEPARRIVPLMRRGGFQFIKVSQQTVMNKGETGGCGSAYHAEWTAHFRA